MSKQDEPTIVEVKQGTFGVPFYFILDDVDYSSYYAKLYMWRGGSVSTKITSDIQASSNFALVERVTGFQNGQTVTIEDDNMNYENKTISSINKGMKKIYFTSQFSKQFLVKDNTIISDKELMIDSFPCSLSLTDNDTVIIFTPASSSFLTSGDFNAEIRFTNAEGTLMEPTKTFIIRVLPSAPKEVS